jgi:hypothetical protein
MIRNMRVMIFTVSRKLVTSREVSGTNRRPTARTTAAGLSPPAVIEGPRPASSTQAGGPLAEGQRLPAQSGINHGEPPPPDRNVRAVPG